MIKSSVKASYAVLVWTVAIGIIMVLPIIAAWVWPITAGLNARKTMNQNDASTKAANAAALNVLNWYRKPIAFAAKVAS